MSFEEALEWLKRERGCWDMPSEECEKFICKDCECFVEPEVFQKAVNVILVAYEKE